MYENQNVTYIAVIIYKVINIFLLSKQLGFDTTLKFKYTCINSRKIGYTWQRKKNVVQLKIIF